MAACRCADEQSASEDQEETATIEVPAARPTSRAGPSKASPVSCAYGAAAGDRVRLRTPAGGRLPRVRRRPPRPPHAGRLARGSHRQRARGALRCTSRAYARKAAHSRPASCAASCRCPRDTPPAGRLRRPTDPRPRTTRLASHPTTYRPVDRLPRAPPELGRTQLGDQLSLESGTTG